MRSSTKWENIKWKFGNIRNPQRVRLAACHELNLINKFIFVVKRCRLTYQVLVLEASDLEIRRVMSGSNVWKVSSVKIFHVLYKTNIQEIKLRQITGDVSELSLHSRSPSLSGASLGSPRSSPYIL